MENLGLDAGLSYLPPARGRMADDPLQGVLTIQEAADLLGLHRETVRRAIRTGELKATRLGYRTVRITKADLQAWFMSKGGRPLFTGTGEPTKEPEKG
jgi:excisionase family DNA binding protein